MRAVPNDIRHYLPVDCKCLDWYISLNCGPSFQKGRGYHWTGNSSDIDSNNDGFDETEPGMLDPILAKLFNSDTEEEF